MVLDWPIPVFRVVDCIVRAPEGLKLWTVDTALAGYLRLGSRGRVPEVGYVSLALFGLGEYQSLGMRGEVLEPGCLSWYCGKLSSA